MSVDSWAANAVGKELGIGDARGQCVGLSWDYVTNELQSNFISPNYGPHAPYAIGSWDSGQVPNGMTRIAGSNDIQKGDVLFWKFFSPEAPLSHTAVAMGKPAVGMVDVMSQNSPLPIATRQELPTFGIAGVWRPANGSGDSTATTASDITVGPFTFDPSNAAGLAIGMKKIFDTMTGIAKDFSAVNSVLVHISNPQLWQRIGLFSLGAILIIVILVKLAGDTDVAQAVAKGVIK